MSFQYTFSKINSAVRMNTPGRCVLQLWRSGGAYRRWAFRAGHVKGDDPVRKGSRLIKLITTIIIIFS